LAWPEFIARVVNKPTNGFSMMETNLQGLLQTPNLVGMGLLALFFFVVCIVPLRSGVAGYWRLGVVLLVHFAVLLFTVSADSAVA
jgi:hypothetical protein